MTTSRPLVVFGSSGFVGRHVVRAAEAWGGLVVCVTRRPGRAAAGVQFVEGDLASAVRLARLLPRGAVVLNLAYDPTGGHDANLALADGIAEVCDHAGAERLVHLSTAMVVGVVKQRWVDESTACNPRTPYQMTKVAVEERLRHRMSGSRPAIMLRPTAIFGEGGLNLKKLHADLTTQPRSRNYLRACLFGTRPLNLVPVETVAAAALFAARSEEALAHDVYFVADDENRDNNYRYVELAMRRGLGLPPYPIPPVSFPQSALRLALSATGRLSFDPRTRFSSARLVSSGFARPVSFNRALELYVQQLRGGPSAASGLAD